MLVPGKNKVRRGEALSRSASTRVMEASGDSVDGCAQGEVQVRAVRIALFSAQKFHLNQAHGIDIRVAQLNGSGQHSIVAQQLALSRDLQDHPAGSKEFVFQHGEHSLSHIAIADQSRINAGDLNVGLGHA